MNDVKAANWSLHDSPRKSEWSLISPFLDSLQTQLTSDLRPLCPPSLCLLQLAWLQREWRGEGRGIRWVVWIWVLTFTFFVDLSFINDLSPVGDTESIAKRVIQMFSAYPSLNIKVGYRSIPEPHMYVHLLLIKTCIVWPLLKCSPFQSLITVLSLLLEWSACPVVIVSEAAGLAIREIATVSHRDVWVEFHHLGIHLISISICFNFLSTKLSREREWRRIFDIVEMIISV